MKRLTDLKVDILKYIYKDFENWQFKLFYTFIKIIAVKFGTFPKKLKNGSLIYENFKLKYTFHRSKLCVKIIKALHF